VSQSIDQGLKALREGLLTPQVGLNDIFTYIWFNIFL
jgi:hypothetical protein